MVRPGKTIMVPNRNGFDYTVKRGDSLSALSRSFKADAQAIKTVNRIQSDIIRTGQVLFIPDGIKPRPVSSSPQRTAPSEVARKVQSGQSSAPASVTAPAAARKPHAVATTSQKIFSWPLHGQLTSGFGQRRDPFTGQNVFHYGIDIGVVSGTPVKASAAGKVIFGGWNGGYGNCVVIEHENGYITVYGHLSTINVTVEQKVGKGQVIALSGNTGLSTGAHLHFEIRRHLTALNPLRFL
jgi:murein DD-endopeptidase MepM/ murein hydrolase activator NlpD